MMSVIFDTHDEALNYINSYCYVNTSHQQKLPKTPRQTTTYSGELTE